MNEKQVQLLKNALNLYAVSLGIDNPYSLDGNSEAENALYELEIFLSEKLGIEI